MKKPLLGTFGVSVACITCILLINTIARSQAPLQIGDKLPSSVLQNAIKASGHEGNATALQNKLLIIDFWATWCAPCISAFPKLDSLQKAWDAQIQILPVTYQSRKEVEQFKNNMRTRKGINITLPLLAEDTILHSHFPHRLLPHCVWINSDGTVIAITSGSEITGENIQKALSKNNTTNLQVKEDKVIPYFPDQPLILGNDHITEKRIAYMSSLTGYIDGLPSKYTSHPPDLQHKRITVTNTVLQNLFKYAYGNGQLIPKNRIILEVKDQTPFTSELRGEAYKNWMAEFTHGYEVIVPAEKEKEIFAIMQSDLKNYFPQYTATWETRTIPCLALVRTTKKDKLKSTGTTTAGDISPFGSTMKNKKLSWLVAWLNAKYLQHLPTPIIDKTGYTLPVDLTLEASMSNVEAIRKQLALYDLDLVPKNLPVKVLIIRDTTSPTSPRPRRD